MQPNYKEQPLKEEINDPAGNSTKLTNRNKQVKKLARNLQMMGTDPFFNDYYAGQQEKAKQIELEQNVLGHIEKTVNAVSDIFKDETTGENLERKLATHNVGDTFLPDVDEQSTQSIGKMKQFMEDLKSSLPKRIHDEGQSRFLSERAKDFVEQSKSKFLQLYGKSPEQIITENGDKENNNIEFLEAQSILHLEKFSNDLNKPNDDFYWDKIDWSKSIFDQNKDAVKGLISDLYRSITSSFGMKSTNIPITSEGEQNIWNKIYKSSYDKLPENSFIKQSLPSKDFQGILNFSLMDKLPKGDRPFAIDAMNGIVGSLAALPFYMWGLENLGLIKAGETGLKHLGGKEFTKRLLMSPVYTQPFQMGNQITENITNAKTVGDIFLGIGKPYLNALAEVTGETMTPILGLGLSKLKLWNKLSDGVEKSLQQLTGKFNTNLKTTTDWLMISPVTEAFEEEISNFINVEPSIFSGDFNLKRLSLEAISALGMGVPIGIVSQITRNKIESEIKNSDGFKQYLDEETLREENPTVDDYFEWLNQKQIKQEKTVQDAVSKTYETETTKQYKTLDEITNGIVQFGIQKSEQSKELQQELLDRIEMPTEEDLDLIKPNTILQTLRDTFGTQSQPEEVTLPMVANENKNNIEVYDLAHNTVIYKDKDGTYVTDYLGDKYESTPEEIKQYENSKNKRTIPLKSMQDSDFAYKYSLRYGSNHIGKAFFQDIAMDVINGKIKDAESRIDEFTKKSSVGEMTNRGDFVKVDAWQDPALREQFKVELIKDIQEKYNKQNVTSPQAQEENVEYYHASMFDFDKFETNVLGRNTNAPSATQGFFFTTNPKVSLSYIKDETVQNQTRKADNNDKLVKARGTVKLEWINQKITEYENLLSDSKIDGIKNGEWLTIHGQKYNRIKYENGKYYVNTQSMLGIRETPDEKYTEEISENVANNLAKYGEDFKDEKYNHFKLKFHLQDFYEIKSLLERGEQIPNLTYMDFWKDQSQYNKQLTDYTRNKYAQYDKISFKHPQPTVYKAKLKFSNPMTVDFEAKKNRPESYFDLIQKAKKQGHDALIIKNTFDAGFSKEDEYLSDIIVVFSPDQIEILDKIQKQELADLKSNLENQQNEIQQINVNETVSHTFKQQEQSPNIEQLDKESQLENTSGLNYKQSSDGLLDMLRKQNLDLKTHNIDTPEKFFNWVQSFKTGNHTYDWLKFQIAWMEKFGYALDKQTKLQSNRTLLQEVFVSFYHSSKKPAVKLTIKNNTVKVEQYTGNSYVDADGIQKSLFGQEELWEKVQDILPEGSTVYRINQVQFGNIYNSFLDIKDQPLDVVMVRNELLKQGYYWTGILPNSNTSLLIDIQNLIPDSPNKDNVDKWYAELDMFVGQALLNITDPLIKTKRIKATTGESPSAFVFPDLQDKLSKLTPASNVYYTQVDGKDQINYKYVVLDDSTVPQEFLSSLGDGEEYITPFLAEVIWDANGTPYIKRGAIKPKYFDLGVFWKWARKIRPPKSKMDYFMQKNGIASIVFSSTIKVGKPENMITWEQLNTQQTISKDFIMEHNILEDSNLMDKGKISKKAAGIGPNIVTTGIMHFLSRQGQNDVKQWLNQDFIELQNEFAKYIQDPYALEKEILSYVNDMDFSDDVTELIKSLENYPYAMRLPVVMDFMMKGNFKEKMFDAARHFKKGSSPAYVLDLGPLSNYKALENADPEAFDDKGYLKPGYIIIDAFTAKKFKYSVGDKVFTALNPPGAFVDLRAEKIAAILPEKMGANQLVGSILSYQDASGKDGDIDTVNLIYVGTELDKKVWQHIKSANLEERYKEMMEKFKDKNTAKNILMFLNEDNPDYKPSEKEIQAWEKIAPLVRMEDNNDGVFALNTDFSKLTFENPDHWKGVQILSKEGLIGQLYNWKAIYTLFLENDYNLNGITANPDTNFTLPMLKQLTDMALDWTNTLDIAKIKFNWQDLVGKLFSFPKQYDKNVFTGFEKALKPIKDALVLTKQKDRGGDKFDYISYHEAISKAKQQLAKLPNGLEGSLLSMTIDGLEQIHLPKLAMTLPQINSVYNKLVYTMLGVPEAAVESNTKMRATKLANTGLGTSLDVIKALSRLGTHANNVNDELLNIRLLRSKSEDNLKAGRTNPLALSHPVTSVFNDWLNKVMETPTTKPDSLGKSVTIGQTRKNGYRYKFTNIDGELQYSIISVADNNVINTETFADWKTFREKGGTDLNNWLVSEEIINLFKDIVQTSGNKVVKSVSDDLLKEIFPKIIDRESFQKADKNTKESFYYAVLGIVKANDWGLQVTDRPGVRNPLDANRFIKPDRNKKESIVSFAKPIAFLENFAYKDDVAIEVLVKFKRTVNALIEQELHKEQENTKPMYSLIFPVLPPALETKRVTLKNVMKLIPSNLTTEQEQQEWLDKTVRDNIATENDKKIFEKIVLKGLAEANKKYKFGWRAALMNPFVNAHTIPFDVFVDIFGKKDKLYTANQVVQRLPVDGRIVDITANEVDVTFKHWSLGTKSKLISDAQIFWYVQHSLDRSYELARITQEQLIDSISKYVMASNQELDKTDRGKIVKEAKVYDSKFINVYLEKIWDKAEDITFRNSLVGFDLNQDINAYYDFAMGKKVVKSLDANGKPTTKTVYEDTDIDSVKVKVGAMRYRYMFDVVVAKMLNDQLTNLRNIQDLALEDNNLNAYTTAQAFIEEIQTMQRQMEGINSTSAYMPHTWDSKEYWMEARIKIYEKAGVTKKEAEKKAKKDWEDKENRTSIVGGLGNYVDVFFLTREANMDGYIKTPESAKRYFNQLNRLMRFQHLFAIEELMDNKISGEIPFMYKHAKEMAARVRGADKYGIKTSFENVKPNDLVLFNKTGKDDIQIIIGKVQSVGNNKFTMADGLTVSKFQVTGLQKLWGNSVESRARIVFNKLGFDVNADREMLPVLAKYMLKLQASSMLTGSTFAVRNLLGGKLQELVFFGTDVMAKATNFVRTVGMDTLQKDTTDIQKEQFRLVYENSVALLGNIDEIMGKFGTIISALSEVNGIPNEHLDEMIRLKQDWDGTKTDLKALGIDPKLRYSKGQLNGNAIIRLNQFWTPFVKFMNFNFLANKKVEGVFGGSITNPGLGEKQLRFHTAIAAVEMHSGLDITNPQEKRLLVAFIDQAVRNTQFLYRVGLDQGMLESSPIARTLWSNYMHYPVSSFCTSFYYVDNWLKQRKEYKGRLVGLKDTEAFKKEYGTHSLPNQLIINENTPDEETIVFADTRYASVVRRMVQIKMLLEIMKTGSKMIKLRTFGVVSGVADVLLWLADLTSTSYALTGSSAISQLAMSLLSSLIPDDDEEDKLSKLKKVLYLTQEEYLADIQDKKWAEDVSDKVIKSAHTQNLIKGILDDVPVGVGASNIFDGLIASLVSGSLLPDNYQELGVSIANTYLPIRPLRNPLLGNIVGIFNPELGNNIKYPLNIGYNPLHTAKIKYEKEQAQEKIDKPKKKKKVKPF